MSMSLIESLNQTGMDLQLLRPGDTAFDALAERFATHPGVEANYVVAVRPGNAEAAQHAVAAAHAHGAGLLTVFNASNVGARLCGDGNTVILDLSRLDRVLEVDVANGYARVEPGVSYAALSAYLAEHGNALQVDSERDGSASIVGSTFAKGIGYTPYGEHALVQCGAEFATPYGELVRTGMGAMPGSKTWQLYKYALGPYSDGLAMQSGLLVPTQIGVWLMGQVPVTQTLAYEIANTQARSKVMERVRTGRGAMPGSKTWHLYKVALWPYSDGLAMQSGLLVPTQIGVWLMGQVPVTQPLAYEIANTQALSKVMETVREFKIANLLPGTVSLTHREFDAARHPVDASRVEWRLATALYGLPDLIALAKAAVEGALSSIDGVRSVSVEEQTASPVWKEQASL